MHELSTGPGCAKKARARHFGLDAFRDAAPSASDAFRRGAANSPMDSAPALETCRGPQHLHVVVDVKCRDRFGQLNPRQPRTRENVRVGRQGSGIVQRANADEAKRRASAVVAPNRGVANGASIDVVWAAAFGGNGNRLGLTRNERNTIRLDHRVDYEGTPRLPLTVTAVTAIDEHRRGAELIPHGSASTTTFEVRGHCCLLRFHGAPSVGA